MSESLQAPRFQIADILRQYVGDYRQVYRLSPEQSKAVNAILACRTPVLGGHSEICDHCGHTRAFLHSCRNRHCPRCQYLARQRWLAARKKDLLPIVYYHVVFTIPDNELNPLVLVNKRVIYEILFRSASETLLQLGRDPKHLGAEIGVTAILHSWSQKLLDHHHLHCIVTGGGLAQDGTSWILPKKTTEGRDFFIHVNVLSELFKKKFLAYLKNAYESWQLQFVGRVKELEEPHQFQALLSTLYALKWNSYCKESFGGPEDVVDYLGQYTHRVAISNYRIVDVKEEQVSFSWMDRENHERKVMQLNVVEFIRRFLLHILPHGFYKIRYYGIVSSRNHKQKLGTCKQLLNAVATGKDISDTDWQILLFELTGFDLRICPKCKTGHMVNSTTPLPTGLAPPR